MLALKPVAGIQFQRVMPAPWSPKPKPCERAPKATTIETTHEATTAQMATSWMPFWWLRPKSPVRTKPSSGIRGIRGIRKVIGLVPHRVVLVNERRLLVPEYRNDDRQAHRGLGRGDGYDQQRNHRRVRLERGHEGAEGEDGQVDGVEHQLDRHQHADRIAAGEEAEGSDGEEQARKDQVGVERIAHRRSSLGLPGSWLLGSRRARYTAPTTAAVSRTLTTSNGRT